MNIELTAEAIDRAQELTRKHHGILSDAFAWHIQETHDRAVALREDLASRGYHDGQQIMRTLRSMQIPEERGKAIKQAHVEPCPLCGAELVQVELYGASSWMHSPAAVAQSERCIFETVHLTESELPVWNRRIGKPVKPSHVPTQAMPSLPGKCKICHSMTPDNYRRICGNGPSCPYSGDAD